MTLEVFQKTGEIRDKHGDWDGDIGDTFEIDISDSEIENKLVDFLIDDYVREPIDAREHVLIEKALKDVISDFYLFDVIFEHYRDDLNEWASKECES